MENLDGLASQIISLKKKFTTYASFAGKPISEIFDDGILDKTKVFKVTELQSAFLRNNEGRFTFVPFQNELQVSPLMAFVSHDFDGDGKQEVLAAGNYFGTKPYHGRFDSFPGGLIKHENNVILGSRIGLSLSQKSVRHLNVVDHGNQSDVLITINNDSIQGYKINSGRQTLGVAVKEQDLK